MPPLAQTFSADCELFKPPQAGAMLMVSVTFTQMELESQAAEGGHRKTVMHFALPRPGMPIDGLKRHLPKFGCLKSPGHCSTERTLVDFVCLFLQGPFWLA